MWVPLAVLAVASVLGGYLLKNGTDLSKAFSFLGGESGPAVMEHWLYPHAAEAAGHHPVSHLTLLIVSLVAAFGGMAVGWLMYAKNLPESEGWDMAKWAGWRKAAGRQFGIDHALSDGSVELGGKVGDFTAAFDRTVIDGIVNGVGSVASGLGGILGRFQRGYVRGYALLMQLGAAALVGYFFYLLMQLGAEPK